MITKKYDWRNLPDAPEMLSGASVDLLFREICPGDEMKGYVPWYHFRIVSKDGVDVGHINFRTGDTDHIRCCAGHIGYEVLTAYRGRGYSYHACQTIAPFVKSIRSHVLLTVDPENIPSIRTIEKLGCTFIDKVEIAKTENAYKQGMRFKCRYHWYPCLETAESA